MNSPPSTTLVVSLILILAILFALGVFWMFRKRTAPQPWHPHRGARPTHTAEPDDEWEAQAPYPEHAVRFAQQPRRTERPEPDPAWGASARDALHEELGRQTQALQDAWNPLWQDEPSATEDASGTHASPTESTTAPLRCPHCLSSRIDTRNLARKAGSTIGSVAGATGAMTAALAGAETGAVVGSVAGPLGSVFGGLAGAVIAGLAGSAAGCAAGSVVGAAIDANVLDNYRCLACEHVFSVAHD